MKLTDAQESAIRTYVEKHDIKVASLREDLIDHLCCVVETRIRSGEPLELLIEAAASELAPAGLKDVEKQTLYLLNSNKIIMMKKAMYLTGFLGAFSLTAGTTFKIMHWPGANVLLVAGVVLLLLLFIPMLVVNKYKANLGGLLSEKLKLIFGILASVTTGLSIVFKFLHLQGASVLLILGAFTFAFGFLPFLFFNLYKKSVA